MEPLETGKQVCDEQSELDMPTVGSYSCLVIKKVKFQRKLPFFLKYLIILCNIYIYIYIGSLCIDFSVLQCLIYRSRARYVYMRDICCDRGKNREIILSSGPLKKITSTIIFHGASFHQDRPATAQTKDATSASKKNYSSFADLNYHHSINVMSSCPRAAAETKRYCVTIEYYFYANL